MGIWKTACCFLAAFSLCCSSADHRKEELWEGVDGSRVQVLAVLNYSDYETAFSKEQIVAAAKQRAIVFITNDITIRFPLLTASAKLDSILIECLEKPVVLLTDCGDMGCMGLVAFDIEPALAFIMDEYRTNQPEQPEQ